MHPSLVFAQLQPGDGGGYIQGATRPGQLDLRGRQAHAFAAAQEHDQLIGDLARQNRLQWHACKVAMLARAEQVARGAIRLQNAHLGVERDHCAGDGLQDRFQLTAALLERPVGS